MKIRALTTHDLDDVWMIEQQAHSHPWSESMIRDLSYTNTHNANKYHFGLWVDDQLVGYLYSQTIVGEVTLLTVAVDPIQQGKGYGKYLIEHLISHSEQNHAESIWLEVRESNTIAQKLYQSYGFNAVDLRENYYPSATSSTSKEDALVMCCYLNDHLFGSNLD